MSRSTPVPAPCTPPPDMARTTTWSGLSSIPILMPVDDNGVLTDEAVPFAGLTIDEANPDIIEWLREQARS